MRILVAEDDWFIREELAARLTALGHSVIAVENGQRLLDELGAVQPDIVITDYQMPCKDGLQVLDEMRRMDAHATRQVIVFSGQRIGEQVHQMGGIYVQKPDFTQIWDTIEKLASIAH